MALKIQKIKSIFDPIAAQAEKLQNIISKSSNKSLKVASVRSELKRQLQLLSEKLASFCSDESSKDYQETKDKITLMIQDFCNTSDVPIATEKDGNDLSDFLDNLVTALKKLEYLECSELKQQLQDSLDYVKEMGEVNEIEDLQNIRELGLTLLDIIPALQAYGKSLISNLLREKMHLYIQQLYTSFAMLAKLVQEQHEMNLPIYAAKKYICERNCWCFKMIIEIMDSPNPSEEEENEEEENHFVYKMDMALDLISSLPEKSPQEQVSYLDDLWLAVEEVFSYAMAIAQVCQPESFKAITGVSQSVISEFENLKSQITAEHPDAMLNSLFVNTFTDALYRLERKVNISVLALVMEVFSDPFRPLKNLVKMCGHSLKANMRNKSDLNNEIEAFDQITDKVMQIGFYAIACSGNVSRTAKIKYHMASLESLESELIPAIVSFYLHPDNREIRAGVTLLTTQWQLEFNRLHTAIDLIIDSGAYCEVILEDLQDRVYAMSDCLDNRRGITEVQVQGIVQRACTLATQLTTTVDDIGPENIDKKTLMMIRELKAAICEADAASKALLVGKANPTEPEQLRVIKRCELLLNVVIDLQPALVLLINNFCSAIGSSKNSKIYQSDLASNFSSLLHGESRKGKSISYIRTPYTVKNSKPSVSIQSANSVPKSPRDLSCLIPYIQRGRSMRAETSIMYETPRNKNRKESLGLSSRKTGAIPRNLACVRQHLFSRDSFLSQSGSDRSNESLDITNILDNLSLDATTKSRIGQSHGPQLDVCSNFPPKNFIPKASNCSNFPPKNPIPTASNCSNFPQKSAIPKASKINKISKFLGFDETGPRTVIPNRLFDIARIDKRIKKLQKNTVN